MKNVERSFRLRYHSVQTRMRTALIVSQVSLTIRRAARAIERAQDLQGRTPPQGAFLRDARRKAA